MISVSNHISKINIHMVSASSTPWGLKFGNDCSSDGHLMGHWVEEENPVQHGRLGAWKLQREAARHLWKCCGLTVLVLSLESSVVFASMMQDKNDPGYVYSNEMLMSVVCLSMTTPLPSQETQCILWMNCIRFSCELLKPPRLGLESGGMQ